MPDKPDLDEVLREEAEHANREYASHASNLAIQPQMFTKYRSPRELHDWRQLSSLLLGDIRGKAFLDYGCGMGEESMYFAKLGARVTAIDVSDVGVGVLRQRAEANHLTIDAHEMKCVPTKFPSSSFDVVHGLGILHHVGIEQGLREVWRVLRPGGIGVFLEPIGNSPRIESAKQFLMKRARFLGTFDEVTEHEHNLSWEEIENAVTWFSNANVFPYHLLYRIKRFFPYSTHDVLKRIDHALLTMAPRLRYFAGAAVIRVQKQSALELSAFEHKRQRDGARPALSTEGPFADRVLDMTEQLRASPLVSLGNARRIGQNVNTPDAATTVDTESDS
jgi:2-polyprenyl-3-methyl-5-hydroxy-6-metoxy-1,4-benzoquinol methylase